MILTEPLEVKENTNLSLAIGTMFCHTVKPSYNSLHEIVEWLYFQFSLSKCVCVSVRLSVCKQASERTI